MYREQNLHGVDMKAPLSSRIRNIKSANLFEALFDEHIASVIEEICVAITVVLPKQRKRF